MKNDIFLLLVHGFINRKEKIVYIKISKINRYSIDTNCILKCCLWLGFYKFNSDSIFTVFKNKNNQKHLHFFLYVLIKINFYFYCIDH